MKRLLLSCSVLLTVLLLLSGCTDKWKETSLQLAKDRLAFLESEAEGDVLTLGTEHLKRPDGTYLYQAHSETFGADFQIGVAPDHTVTDDYYTLAVRAEAETVYGPFRNVLPGKELSLSVSVKSILTPALSSRVGASLLTVQNAAGGQPLVRLEISVPDGETLTEQEIGTFLNTLYVSACPCEVTFQNDARTFVVDGDGISYLTADADGGSYIKRHEYTIED